MQYQNMAKTSSISLLSLCLHAVYIFQANCSNTLVPALYVFGDSSVDSGNNNLLPTIAKVDFKPYGIDFPNGPTGRFTNGRTSVDFIAEFLGLPFVPPYNGLSEAQKSEIVTGINYASGTAGILLETGSALGKNVALEVQIQLFKETVNHYLPRNFRSQNELLQYLSRSIFVVFIGTNDYGCNYLQPALYNTSLLYNPEQYAGILLKELRQHLQGLYNLGARKFLVFNLPPIGCAPAIVKMKNVTRGCAHDINKLISPYNKGFPSMLQELRTSLHGSTFVLGDVGFLASYLLDQNPSINGLITADPCCITNNVTYLCHEDESPCVDRDTHIFWDAVHPTQMIYFLLAFGCFYAPFPCTPINVLELALKQQEADTASDQQSHSSS